MSEKSKEIYGEVYKIINKANGKLYVGQTIQGIHARFLRHLQDARNGVDTVLCRAIRKHGESNFVYIKIEDAYSFEELNEREIYWINTLKSHVNHEKSNGYNMKIGWQCHPSELNALTKLKKSVLRSILQDASTGEYSANDLSEKYNISKSSSNNIFGGYIPHIKEKVLEIVSPEEFQDIVKKVRARGEEDASRKISEQKSKKNHHFWGKRGADCHFSKPVEQLDIETREVLKEFPSATEAAKFYGLYDCSKIAMVCRGKRNSSAGFAWRYKN